MVFNICAEISCSSFSVKQLDVIVHKKSFPYIAFSFLVILYPTSLANLEVEVDTRQSHQILFGHQKGIQAGRVVRLTHCGLMTPYGDDLLLDGPKVKKAKESAKTFEPMVGASFLQTLWTWSGLINAYMRGGGYASTPLQSIMLQNIEYFSNMTSILQGVSNK